MGKRAWLLSGVVAALVGCMGPDHLDPAVTPPGSVDPIPTPSNGPSPFLDVRVMAQDPVSLTDPPPPITGGTLYVTRAGDTAIVSDPDRDRIVVVDLVAGTVRGTASLPPASEPFRATEDLDGNVHVVLRGSGDVFSFAPASVESGTRHHVCAMPRGIAYDGENDALVVACRSGSLVTLGTDGAVRSTVQVEPDLRDVVISQGRLFVSTFRTAHLLEVSPTTGAVLSDTLPETTPNFGSFDGTSQGFSPGVAWRTAAVPGTVSSVPNGAHTIAAVHQRASDVPVEPSQGGYGAGGGGSLCGESSIVQSAVTIYSLDGTHTEGTQLRGATLPVDIAFSRDGQRVTVIAAANESGDQAVQTYDVTAIRSGGGGTCLSPTIARDAPDAQVITNPIAAAYDGVGRLIVQQREPSQLVYMGRTIPLNYLDGRRAEARFDTGHAVFHGNSGAFIACASCHPEGGDDGRVWNFDGIGDRRTPALHGDLRGTEPFHWDGDMTDLHVLVHQVFTSRMSGPELPAHHVDARGNGLVATPAPVHETGADEAAVTRGQDLFYGDAECATCHSGPLMTNNETVDVGTGGHFQVPSLIGVSYRTPLMHDGACPTLRARLTDAACSGGEHHGHTSGLTPGQVNDMVAFLNTL